METANENELKTRQQLIRELTELRRRIVGSHSFARDMTEQKTAEEALRESEEEARRPAQENAVMAKIGQIISSTIREVLGK